MVSIKTKGWSLCFLIIFSSLACMTSGHAPKPNSWGGISRPRDADNDDDTDIIVNSIFEIIESLFSSDEDDAEAGSNISVQIYIIIGALLANDCDITEDGDKIRDDILTVICVLFGLKGDGTDEGDVLRREICKIIQELFLSDGGPYASRLRVSIITIISLILKGDSGDDGTDIGLMREAILEIVFIVIGRIGLGEILQVLPELLGLFLGGGDLLGGLLGGGGSDGLDLSGLSDWGGTDGRSQFIRLIIIYYLRGAGSDGLINLGNLFGGDGADDDGFIDLGKLFGGKGSRPICYGSNCWGYGDDGGFINLGNLFGGDGANDDGFIDLGKLFGGGSHFRGHVISKRSQDYLDFVQSYGGGDAEDHADDDDDGLLDGLLGIV